MRKLVVGLFLACAHAAPQTPRERCVAECIEAAAHATVTNACTVAPSLCCARWCAKGECSSCRPY